MSNEDEQIGVKIVRKSLEIPMIKIAENAGKDVRYRRKVARYRNQEEQEHGLRCTA